ncbi:unnamed protein product, partial [Arabidopsis halleri]
MSYHMDAIFVAYATQTCTDAHHKLGLHRLTCPTRSDKSTSKSTYFASLPLAAGESNPKDQ